LQDEFVAAIKARCSTHFPDGTLGTPYTGKIINGNHYERVLNLLAKSNGHKIIGGGHDDETIELTVLKDVPADDPLVKE
jgi:aldehyde dehydrogenase (NAD+)